MRGEWTPSKSEVLCALPGAQVYAPALSPELPDWCEPLNDPRWVAPAEASLMRDEDPVVGFEAAGRTWAIPWWVLKNHHCANLTLGGRPFLVTLCEMCVAGGVFDPTLEGRPVWFQMNGWYNGSPLMTDGLTRSLWALIHGRCVAGPLQGAALPMRPIVHARWREWATMYPETLVVQGEGEPRDGHGAEMWGPDHQMGCAEIRGIASNELVVGVELGESRRSYLLTALHNQGGIVEDVLDGCPIVVVTLPGTWVCVAFVAELDGTPVRLQWDRRENPPTHLVDSVSGRRFDLWGRCLMDEHRGVALPYVRSALKKWGRWVMVNPDGELWQAGRAPATVS